MSELRCFTVLCCPLLVLLACAPKQEPEPVGPLRRIVESGELRVGTSGEHLIMFIMPLLNRKNACIVPSRLA